MLPHVLPHSGIAHLITNQGKRVVGEARAKQRQGRTAGKFPTFDHAKLEVFMVNELRAMRSISTAFGTTVLISEDSAGKFLNIAALKVEHVLGPGENRAGRRMKGQSGL